MTAIRFIALSTEVARAYQAGGPDAYGRRPERKISDGDGLPCRHCLEDIEAGAEYLILAHRPFGAPQPYAETGPIFLHARQCGRHPETAETPALYLRRPQILVRGYGADERIVYGTGQVVPSAETAAAAARLLERPEVAFVHLRSATNNCYACRVERA